NGQPSSSKSPPLSSSRHSTPILARRSSSRISSRTVSSPGRASSTRGGGVSKTRISHGGGNSTSTRTTQSTTKKKGTNAELHINTDDEMDAAADGIQNSSQQQQDKYEQKFLLNTSAASADTVIDQNLNVKRKLFKRANEYFTFIDGSRKYKCSICTREYKSDTYSDSNLRSHLGFQHGMHQYLFPSQLKQRERHQRKPTIITHQVKQEFDAAAIQCIVDDGLAFGIFRRSGMQGFLATAVPGYRGPSRQTVRKTVHKLYQQRRSSLRQTLKTVLFIALTTDLWVNSRRTHFLAITAHYYNEHFQYSSVIISFRRFRGRHLAERLRSFIIKEIDKLNIQMKIVSVTVDSGSDIKAAVSVFQCGTRYSCDAHNINLTISAGLGLWKISKSKR
ncbi:unnamed protein product, partial [Didymodactylos carnosus]